MYIHRIAFHLFLITNLLTVFGILILNKDIVNSAAIALVLFISASLLFLIGFKRIKITKLQGLVLVLIIFGAVSVLCLQNLILDNAYDQYGRSALGWSAVAMISNLIWFCWGLVISNSIEVKGRSVPLAYTGVLFYTILVNIEDVFKGVVFSAGNSHGGSETFNHLFVASNVVILYFYCFSAFKGISRLLLSVVYLFLLFALQGRAALIGCIITIIFFWVISTTLSQKLKTIIVCSTLIILISPYVDIATVYSHLGERFNFSGGVGGDTSFYNRLKGMAEGIEWLPQQFFFGDPTIFINHMSGLGSYMHNFLSVWQIYGFPFSLILLFSVFYGVVKFYLIFDFDNSSHVFIFLVLVYSLVQMIIAQSILFKMFWFVLGVILVRSKNFGSEKIESKRNYVG